MVVASFLSTLFLALAVAAHPVEQIQQKAPYAHLNFVKRFSTGNVFNQDTLRAKSLKNPAGKVRGVENRAVINSQAENRAATYVASVGVGSPATDCK